MLAGEAGRRERGRFPDSPHMSQPWKSGAKKVEMPDDSGGIGRQRCCSDILMLDKSGSDWVVGYLYKAEC